MEISNMQIVPVGKREVFCPYITKNGRRIYPRNGRVFHFWVDDTPDVKVNKPQQLSMFDEPDA